jgi:hypothetical protein
MGASTYHSPMGLYGLLQGYLYLLTFTEKAFLVIKHVKTHKEEDAMTNNSAIVNRKDSSYI